MSGIAIKTEMSISKNSVFVDMLNAEQKNALKKSAAKAAPCAFNPITGILTDMFSSFINAANRFIFLRLTKGPTGGLRGPGAPPR